MQRGTRVVGSGCGTKRRALKKKGGGSPLFGASCSVRSDWEREGGG